MSDENDQPEVESETSESIICIDPVDFDPSRVVIKSPQVNEFTLKSGAAIKTCTSQGLYLDDNGRECTLYIRGDPQQTFGFSYNYDIQLSKEERVPENANGVQVSYPLTSMKTVHSPKPSEQALEDTFMGLWQAVVDKGRQEIEDDETAMPAVAKASFISAAKKGQWEKAVKIPFSHPKDKTDKKKFDTTKPKSIYTKLVTTGKGSSMKVQTIVNGPGDRVQSALRYIDTPGELTPVWVWEGAYHGAHGNEAPYGTSLRFKLVQCNFVPKSFSGRVPQRRMLPRNTAPVEEEDETYPPARGATHVAANDEEDKGAFTAPGEDSSNPTAALASAAKSKVAAKAKPAPVKAGAPSKKAAPTKGPAKAKAVLASKGAAGVLPAKPSAKATAKATAKGVGKPVAKAAKPKTPEPEDEPEDVEVEDVENDVEDEE